jgi:hypothetical protein
MPDPYLDLIVRRAGAAEADWLRAALERAGSGRDGGAWRAAYAGAARRFGAAELKLAAQERTELAAAGLQAPASRTLEQLARALLLRAALAGVPPAEHESLVRGVYQRADTRERAALLLALLLLPDPARFAPTAVDACRTHVQEVFEAIACENEYPARHFAEPAFNQLVIKALFSDVPLTRIAGLADRIAPELVRMARDYASERRAAGREVSSDLQWIASGAADRRGA